MRRWSSIFVPLLITTAFCFFLFGLSVAAIKAQDKTTITTNSTPTFSTTTISEMVNSQQPRVAIGPRETVYCVFGADGSIYSNHSREAGVFSEPVKIASVEKLALGRRRGPRICLTKDAIVVTAISHQTGQVLSWRSLDQGVSWSESVVVNDAEGSAKEGLHAMAASSDGKLCCVWLDFRNEKMELFGAVSTDHGQNWNTNVKIYTSPEKNICECCHPSVAYDEEGGLHVMWRNSIDGNRDMYYCYSSDGATFGEAKRLGKVHWELNQCPMDGGELVAQSQENLFTIWRRGSMIVSSTGAEETTLGQGEQPTVVLTKSGPVYVWLKRRGGDLLMLRPGQREPEIIAKRANDPNPVSVDNRVLVAYESTDTNNKLSLKLLTVELN